jgi:hypothetical protein
MNKNSPLNPCYICSIGADGVQCKGLFFAGFALGEKAVKAAHDIPLADSILTVIDEAQKYAEGRAVRIEIKSKKALEITKKLAAVKMAN